MLLIMTLATRVLTQVTPPINLMQGIHVWNGFFIVPTMTGANDEGDETDGDLSTHFELENGLVPFFYTLSTRKNIGCVVVAMEPENNNMLIELKVYVSTNTMFPLLD